MSLDLAYAECLDRVAGELQLASVSTTELLVKVIESTCVRIPVLAKAGKTARLRHLIEAGAQVDATLTLIELELPHWRLRRLSRDGDQWLCSLSRQLNLPVEFDDAADGRHEDPVLAILIAYTEALHMTRVISVSPIPTTRSRRLPKSFPICCDDFC